MTIAALAEHCEEGDIIIDGGNEWFPNQIRRSEELGKKVMSETEITISIQLGRGDAESKIWTCDFSYDYVKINAEYRS